MLPFNLRAWRTLALAPLLLACGQPAPVLVHAEPPVAFRECGPQPVPPDPMTDNDLALLILDLAEWGHGCSDKLQRLYLWSKP